MILIEGASDADLRAIGYRLRDDFAYSLRCHPVEPTLAGEVLLPRLADSHPRVCWLRSHVTEVVRGRLLERPAEADWARHQWRLTELAMLALGAVLLVVTPDEAAVNADLPPTWERLGLAAVAAEYAEATWLLRAAAGRWLPRLPTRWVTRRELVDARGGPTALLRAVAAEADSRARADSGFPPPALGSGSLRPAVLIVGEEPCPTPCPVGCGGDEPDLPFSRGPASAALWAALDTCGFRWQTAYLTNASTYRPGTPWRIDQVVGDLNAQGQLRKVLCLGREAGRLLAGVDRGGAEVLEVTHPSHVRQFHGREFNHWRDEVGRFLAGSIEHIDDALERTGATTDDDA